MPTKITTKRKTATTKRKAPVKSQSRSSKKITKTQAVTYRTFRISPDSPAFLQARVSKQTFYWSFLLLFIIVMQLIIIGISVNASLNI
jgi:hypothetical protein